MNTEEENLNIKYFTQHDKPEMFKNLAEISRTLDSTFDYFGEKYFEKDEQKYLYCLNQEFERKAWGHNLEKTLFETYVKINKTIRELKHFEERVDKAFEKEEEEEEKEELKNTNIYK